MGRFTLSVMVLIYYYGTLGGECRSQIQDAHMPVPQLIREAGYLAERHDAVTSDGYILELYRIPSGRDSKNFGHFKKKAVLIIHGLLGCSSNFVIMGPERSLGYILADAGYDVWLGNLRGNVNTGHKNLTRDNPKFWDYSFHEHGKYDVPALIDKVLAVTGLPKLLYIGHSMGATSFFTAMALRPEYNGKVVALVALAPAVYLDNVRHIAEAAIKTFNIINLMRSHGFISLALRPEVLDVLVENLCSVKPLQNNFCVQLLQLLAGEDMEQIDSSLIMHIIARAQPASWRQLEHFAKVAMTSVFTSLDDGVFGKVKPYNLSSVKVPVLILYGDNDHLTEKSQVMRLAKDLKSTGMLEAVRPGTTWPKFQHFDFVFAKDLGTLLNKPLVKHIDRLYKKYSTI